MKKHTFYKSAIMIALLSPAAAIAQTPIDKSAGYGQPGMAVWGTRIVLTTAGTEYSPDVTGNVKDCFAHRTVVSLRSQGGEVACVWVGEATTATITMGATDSANACTVTDGDGPDGEGACFVLSDTERVDQVPWPLGASVPGSRGGLCDAPIRAPGGATVWPPCDTNEDCAGSCVTALSANQIRLKNTQSCSYLICSGDTSGQYLAITVEQ